MEHSPSRDRAASRDVLDRPARPADRTVHYGGDPEHIVDVWLPPDVSGWPVEDGRAAGAPLVVAVHGGFWRAGYDRGHLGPLAEDLSARGYAVAAIEYRRVGRSGGGWPGTFDDVAAAFDVVASLVSEATGGAVDAGGWVALGHSAGGHLALWAAHRRDGLAGVLALAPVADLAEAHTLGVGDQAVAQLLGDRPDLLAPADPMGRLPLGVPVVLVHGADDNVVPVALSDRFAAAAGTAGDRVSLLRLDGVGHFELIDPRSRAWPHVLEALATLRPATR